MKKLVNLIVCLFLLTSCFDNSANPKVEDDNEKIIYPTTSELFDYENNKLGDISYEINDKNQLMSYTINWLEDVGGGWEKVTYEYDDHGNKISEATSYNNSDYIAVFCFEYDENNRLIKQYWKDTQSTYNVFTYDEKGFRKEKLTYNNDELASGKTIYTCDEEGKIIKEDNYYNDVLSYWYINTYNDAGKLTKIAYYTSDRNIWNLSYVYDKEGRLTHQGVVIESWNLNGTAKHYYE